MSNRYAVIDVGSGHNPLPEADIIADRYLSNDERADDLIVDRPFVRCDIEHLPFRDDAFEYANASQVVEHVEDPARAIDELQRVSESGKADCPTVISENIMFGQEFHNWAMLPCWEEVYFVKATHPSHGRIFHRLYESSKTFRTSISLLDILFGIHIAYYFWGDGRKWYKRTLQDRGGGIGYSVKDRIGIPIQYLLTKVLKFMGK